MSAIEEVDFYRQYSITENEKGIGEDISDFKYTCKLR